MAVLVRMVLERISLTFIKNIITERKENRKLPPPLLHPGACLPVGSGEEKGGGEFILKEV
jgi:hypothetical protein